MISKTHLTATCFLFDREEVGRQNNVIKADLLKQKFQDFTPRLQASSDPSSFPFSVKQQPDSGSDSSDLHGRKLNIDIDGVLSRFSQVLNQHRSQGDAWFPTTGSDVQFGARATDDNREGGTGRTREERLQALKASSLNLQSKLATVEISLKPGEKVIKVLIN